MVAEEVWPVSTDEVEVYPTVALALVMGALFSDVTTEVVVVKVV